MHRTIFVAVSSLHLHLVEVVNTDNVRVSSKGSSRHGDFTNCSPPCSYAGMCDALEQCGTLKLNLLNIQIENLLCWTQVWLGMTSRKDQGQYWYNKSIPYQYVPVKAFADGFQRCHVGEWLHQELTIPFDRKNAIQLHLWLRSMPLAIGRFYKPVMQGKSCWWMHLCLS